MPHSSLTAPPLHAVSRRVVLGGGGAAALAGLLPAAAFAQSGASAPDAPRAGAADIAQHRIEVPMPHGGVAAGHPLASLAGVRMLLQGGSAADAAVAAMAVLNVVEPWASSAAGNGFATCLDRKTGKVASLAFTGGAPRLLDPQATAEELDSGPKAVTVPGAFGGWIALLRRSGRLSLAKVLAPAIGYARDGHPLDPSISAAIRRQQASLAKYPTSAAIFLPNGQPPAARALFRNPDLARTFEMLVDAEQRVFKSSGNRDAALQAACACFYTGPIAREFDRFSRATGGWLRMDDLAAYRPVWADPVSTTYRGLEVHCSPLTSRTGLELCQQLNIVEGFDLPAMRSGSPELVHLMAEAIKLTKADVYRYAADPRFANVPVAALLSKAHAERRRRLIDPARAMAFPAPVELAGADIWPATRLAMADERTRGGDTTSLSVIDPDGNVVVVTTTIGGGFGTSLVMGNTGLLFNNGLRIGSTSPYTGHPNKVAPGKRALLGNGPTIVLEGGKLRYAFGSPGGETIGQTQFQFFVHALDLGLPVQAAIEAPRIALDAKPNFYRAGAAIAIQAERRLPSETLATLKAMGHTVEVVGPWSIGSIQAIRTDASGTHTAGGDPRRMGYAVGY